ncbi:MAG: hypothetical protein D6725_11740 [Planctomycetota bacterium]|nr:MAG: hypothetical protein D6725_11740 [Planctomycetota bacterium]
MTGMRRWDLQQCVAAAALVLLPMPALNFGVSLTFGDVLLVIAIALNLHELTRLHSFQIPFLLAAPFFVVSTLVDPDSGVIATLQAIYIWGFVLPFGWAAFTRLPGHVIARCVLLSAAVNSAVAMGQGADLLPQIGKQKLVEFGSALQEAFNRAPGLALNCNTLVVALTPCFLALPYVRRPLNRAALMLMMFGGMASTLSKSVLLAVPGLLYYLRKDRARGRVLWHVAWLTMVVIGVGLYSGHAERVYDAFVNTLQRRTASVDQSVDTRWHLINVALKHWADCVVLGLGIERSAALMMQDAGYTVHVLYLGLVIIGGVPAAVLQSLGMAWLCVKLWRVREIYFAGMLAEHMLACLLTTVLLLSFQSLPVMIAGALVVHTERLLMEAELRSRDKHGDARVGRVCVARAA